MVGAYQRCGENHLQAYSHEFDFRYSNRVAGLPSVLISSC
jgi:hypothetical protein